MTDYRVSVTIALEHEVSDGTDVSTRTYYPGEMNFSRAQAIMDEACAALAALEEAAEETISRAQAVLDAVGEDRGTTTISREELGKQPEEQAAREEALRPRSRRHFQGRDILWDSATNGKE